MRTDGYLDYVELPAPDIAAAKRFYGSVFGWTFADYGANYVEFTSGDQKGGFNAELEAASGGPLLVLWANDLDALEAKVQEAGAEITAHHQFPGGRRFHFRGPNGNELAVWSDK